MKMKLSSGTRCLVVPVDALKLRPHITKQEIEAQLVDHPLNLETLDASFRGCPLCRGMALQGYTVLKHENFYVFVR